MEDRMYCSRYFVFLPIVIEDDHDLPGDLEL